MRGQKCENANSLISGVDDETGFEYVESEVAAGYLDVAVQWEVRKMVWNLEMDLDKIPNPLDCWIYF